MELVDGETLAARLERGKLPLEQAITTAFAGSRLANDEKVSLIQEWFSAWGELGWLCTVSQE